MEVLSERLCQGSLEATCSGPSWDVASYEAFAQVVESMTTQHAKWLEQCREYPWPRPLASLNVLLTSHSWRNDHNGFSHQATGYVDNALARRSEVIRVYYPPDSNCLLSVFDHCLRSRNYVNVVTCGKQPQLQWLNMDEALEHCSQRRVHMEVCNQRWRRGAGCGTGLRRRCTNDRDLRGLVAATEACARASRCALSTLSI